MDWLDERRTVNNDVLHISRNNGRQSSDRFRNEEWKTKLREASCHLHTNKFRFSVFVCKNQLNDKLCWCAMHVQRLHVCGIKSHKLNSKIQVENERRFCCSRTFFVRSHSHTVFCYIRNDRLSELKHIHARTHHAYIHKLSFCNAASHWLDNNAYHYCQ